MSPTPQLKVNELSSKRSNIQDDFVRTHQLDVVACQRLENELKQLTKVHVSEADARLELGMVYGLKRRWSDALSNFNRCRQISSEHSQIDRLQAAAALYCGKTTEALSLLSKVPLCGDPVILRSIRSAAVQSGSYEIAVNCTDRLIALKVDPNDSLSIEGSQGVYHDLYTAFEVVQRAGMSADDMALRIEVASSVVLGWSPEPLLVYGFSATPDAGILYEFPLRLGFSDLVEIEWAISEALVDKIPDYESGVISFSTKPVCEEIAYVA